jgi:hypothetical protein
MLLLCLSMQPFKEPKKPDTIPISPAPAIYERQMKLIKWAQTPEGARHLISRQEAGVRIDEDLLKIAREMK